MMMILIMFININDDHHDDICGCTCDDDKEADLDDHDMHDDMFG